MPYKNVLLSTILTTMLLGCGSTSAPSPRFTLGKMDNGTLFNNHRQFFNNYQSHEVTKAEKTLVESWPSDIVFNVYFGTWCHDSEREVPKLLKLLAYNKKFTVNLIGLDYKKTEPNGSAKANKVQFTPTIIVTRADEELGRIVEQPAVSLVSDITEIIKKHSV